jgi:hypothetical protein
MVHHNIIKRIRLLAAASLLLLASLTPFLFSQDSYAAQLTGRSLTLQAIGSVQGSTPDAVVNHKFDFQIPDSAGSFQSIKFLYCTTADVLESNCTTPTGVDTTSATLDAQNGVTGATMNNATNGAPYLSYAVGQNPNTSGSPGYTSVSYTFGTVHNPTASNETFFVRIIAYSANDGTGSVINAGTVAASTAEPVVLTGVMPESLIFCAGATVEESSPGVPDCSTASTGAIKFNDLFSPTATRYSFSQMAASTNAGDGYAITVNGPTLTSGSYTIPAMASATTPLTGVGQFGMNLVENTTTPDLTQATISASPYNNVDGFDNDGDGGAVTPDVYSANVNQAPNGTNLRGQAATDYNTDGTFKFASGDIVAASDNGGAGPSDAQIYTVSYIANVPGSQAPGTYVTTLLYLCTPTF